MDSGLNDHADEGAVFLRTCPSLIISNISGIKTTIDVVATTNAALPAFLATIHDFSLKNIPPA